MLLTMKTAFIKTCSLQRIGKLSNYISTIPKAIIPDEYIKIWDKMADLSIANNDITCGQIHLSKILANSTISRQKKKVIKLFTTILGTIENNQFLMMMIENAGKNSEDDYSQFTII